MSKKQFKSQARSGRVGSAFGGFGSAGFGSGQSSILSYVQEPPDLSNISDPNVVVSVKNLSKKDGTTKAKALEDLLGHVSAPDASVEDGLLEAWAKLFPRLSVVDNTRRVRQLSHSLNAQICSKCGKRTVKYMPRVAGPWLASTFDGDRAAARAANEALDLVFPSAEKVLGVKKTFQRSILEYCRDSVLHETVQTLNDERNVSSDDAKAAHARVVATALSTVRMLVSELQSEDRSKEADVYAEILREPKLWSFVHDADVGVRRAIDKLILTCLTTQPDLVESDRKTISKAVVYHGLHSDQTSTALEFVQVLESLTKASPSIWNDDYIGKKPAATRLRHFLKQGSQGAPATFWEVLGRLLKIIPQGVLPTPESEIAELLSALRIGVSKKEERFNGSAAWPVYYALADLVISPMAEESARAIVQPHLLPIVKQYLDPSPETADWAVPGARASTLVSRVAKIHHMDEALRQEWPLQVDRLIELERVSQPEQAKDFDKSQKHVASAAERFADLQRDLWALNESLGDVFLASSRRLIKGSLELLESRNGKPYGAAAMVECLLRSCSRHVLADQEIDAIYTAFVKDQLPKFVFGPSKRQLLLGFFALHETAGFAELCDRLLEHVLQAEEPSESKLDVLRTALTSATPPQVIEVAASNVDLQEFIVREVATGRSADSSSLFANLVKLGALSDQTIEKTLSDLTTSLSVQGDNRDGLMAIEALWDADEATVRSFMSSGAPAGEQLVPNVLKLEQSADDQVADQAAALSIKLSSAISGSGAAKSKFSLITQNLESASASSLSMDSLFDLMDRLLAPDRAIEDAMELLPSLELWQAALMATMRPPLPSLALLSPLGGIVQLIRDSDGAADPVQHDAEGLSQALRISMYITKLLTDTNIASCLVNQLPAVQALLYATTILADDNLSVSGSNALWYMHDPNTEEAVLEFVSDAGKVSSEWFKGLATNLTQGSNGYTQFKSTLDGLRAGHEDLSAASYYAGLSSARAQDAFCEIHSSSTEQVQQSETLIKECRAAKDSIRLAATVAGFRQPLAGSQILSRYCNELVAHLTDLDTDSDVKKGFEQLATFNIILSTQEDGIAVVAKQRRIFLVKRLLMWLDTSPSLATQAEICRALANLFEGISDMYGEHWEQAISFLLEFWRQGASGPANNEDAIAAINASLRLLQTLWRLSNSEDPNDDLADTLHDKQGAIRDALVKLLVAAAETKDENHQPLLLTHELLARQLAALPFKPMKDADDMFSLLYAPSRPIMQAAFDLLHQQIPAAQEQISFDAALDNKPAQLPDELLSLLLEAPTLDSLAEASFHRMMPLSLQSYLYSWRILFDHFDGSSYKVKNDYIEQLKEGSYLTNLLDLIFDFLGHTRGRPADASKLYVQEYTPDVESSPERDAQWLLAHLYFLALTHLPSLVKSYYLDIRSRQTSQAIDSWTSKYISPLVIRSSLEAVDEWSKTSVKEDPEYEKMTVKVGMRSREINVSYVVDEQTMAIKVVLPEAYPLASAQVVGVSRVAVKEEKWQSWLRNCQGVITFSNGSITDGLSAWRRNVTGALKGQTECAICYSIISADKQLPTKRCPTCKNLFHSSCLFRWFKTSNASTCPLCRNPFNFN